MVLITGGYFLYKEWPGIKHDVSGYSFEETLHKTTDAAGGKARVLTFLVRGKDFSWAVVTDDGSRVIERFYGELCTSSSRGNHCSVRQSNHERKATQREDELARVRLSDVDPQILGQLRHDSGASDADPVGLRRKQWVIARPEQPYLAEVDGSNLHPAQSANEIALARSVAQAPDTR